MLGLGAGVGQQLELDRRRHLREMAPHVCHAGASGGVSGDVGASGVPLRRARARARAQARARARARGAGAAPTAFSADAV